MSKKHNKLRRELEEHIRNLEAHVVARDEGEIITGFECSEINPGRTSSPSDLSEWWRWQAEQEIEQTIAKSAEYGAHDLVQMGQVMADFANQEQALMANGVTREEIAIAYYALGKITRIIGAYKEGRRPSDDSWMDLHVYAGMAIRARDKGGWPNG
jgi:ABC-type lipoprotein release transport system permease subunit